MKKTVLTFGLISGLIISVLMGGSLLLADKIGSGHSMAIGYTIMVASFLLIYFGIRSYRNNTLAGQISFGRAFACGILIALITTVCYVAMWESSTSTSCPTSWTATSPHRFTKSSPPDLTRHHRRAGRCHTALSAALPEPLCQHGLHLHGALPAGLIITLISAAILRRKAPVEPTAAPTVMTT